MSRVVQVRRGHADWHLSAPLLPRRTRCLGAVDSALCPEALGPGVFAVFRDPADADRFDARSSRCVYLPRVDHRPALLEQQGELVSEGLSFAAQRGRLLTPAELPIAPGGTKPLERPSAALPRRVVVEASLAQAENERTEDLVITLAFERFG